MSKIPDVNLTAQLKDKFIYSYFIKNLSPLSSMVERMAVDKFTVWLGCCHKWKTDSQNHEVPGSSPGVGILL